MKIKRIFNHLDDYMKPGKVLVIYGPRQVGKTTLVEDYLAKTKYRYRLDSGDNISIREILSSDNFQRLEQYAEGYQLIIIDEAQRIPGVGRGLKILVDRRPDLQLIVTGSSSFELAGQIGEPLTGRKNTLTLYPVSQLELCNHYNPYELQQRLEEDLIYGSYPEIITAKTQDEKRNLLQELVNDYLLKDILELDNIKSPQSLVNLLRLLAFQIGSEVSLTEIGQQLGLNYKTVARYISLLEKTFVIYTLHGFSRNLRKEINKKNKYYFYDNGIRNALIANFNLLALRNDIGLLWENFLVIERIKKQTYQNTFANYYFWRTWDNKEIDFVEEREGKLFGYEFKWREKKVKAPKDWQTTYPNAIFELIHQNNYLNFITLLNKDSKS